MHVVAALPVMHCPVRQAEPGMHRLLPDRIARRREGGDIERADRNPAHHRVAVAFPVQVAAAILAEIKGGAGAPPACLAMAEIDALRLARGYHLERSAMALCRPFHCCLPADCW